MPLQWQSFTQETTLPLYHEIIGKMPPGKQRDELTTVFARAEEESRRGATWSGDRLMWIGRRRQTEIEPTSMEKYASWFTYFLCIARTKSLDLNPSLIEYAKVFSPFEKGFIQSPVHLHMPREITDGRISLRLYHYLRAKFRV